jgi:hypothetical protein
MSEAIHPKISIKNWKLPEETQEAIDKMVATWIPKPLSEQNERTDKPT